MQTPVHHLSTRDNWQLGASTGGAQAELDSYTVIRNYLSPEIWRVVRHPTDLQQIYYEYTYKANPSRYVPPEHPSFTGVWWDSTSQKFLNAKNKFAMGGGCQPDCMIQNIATGKKIYIECKNQGLKGNAHERAAKYATPSIIAHVQKKLGVDYVPFAYLFTGAMVDDFQYVVELETTYGFAADNLFLWKKEHPVEPLTQWLDKTILPLLR